MCAIIGSYDVDSLRKLIELNSYRGSTSFSFAAYNEKLACIWRTREHFTLSIPEYEKLYKICHIQAPTSDQRDEVWIHPAESKKKSLLWHNGIIKQNEIERLQKEYNTQEKWDTQLMLELIDQYGFDILSGIDGSFACVYSRPFTNSLDFSTDLLYAFRNEISPLYYDDNMNISSTKFENSSLLPANIVFQLDYFYGEIINTGYTFKTKENPYYFGV